MKNFTILLFVVGVFLSSNLLGQTARFSAEKTKGCNSLSVKFKDESSGATSWLWDLGNGNTSTNQHPQANYTKAGKYTIKLTINNGQSSEVKENYIVVYSIDADISPTKNQGCSPLEVEMRPQVSTNGPVTSWLWNFGDGNMSDKDAPVHTFKSGGDFNILLTVVVDDLCKESFYFDDKTIKVAEFIEPKFEIESMDCNLPRKIVFKEKIEIDGKPVNHENINSYLWTFGDGKTSSEINPTHVYNSEGEFDVKLEVTSAGCKFEHTENSMITIKNYEMDFTADKTTVCSGDEIEFTPTLPEGSKNTKWIYDKDEFFSNDNEKVFYVAGKKDVTLSSVMPDGCEKELTKENFITVKQSPKAYFYSSAVERGIVPTSVSFINTSIDAEKHLWNFGDGGSSFSDAVTISHEYTAFGEYDVSLTVWNGSCSDVKTSKKHVKLIEPEVKLLADQKAGCYPLTVNFSTSEKSLDPIVSYQWDFGDGNTSTEKAPQHTYASTGIFDVKLTLTTSEGYTFTVEEKRFIHSGDVVDVDYTITQNSFSASDRLIFTSNTPGIDSVVFMFDDKKADSYHAGRISPFTASFLPVRELGDFKFNVIAFDRGCQTKSFGKDEQGKHCNSNYNDFSCGDKLTIRYPLSILEFDKTSFCETPATVKITDKSIGADEVFIDFGDGTTSNKKVTSHTYEKTGAYHLKYVSKNHNTGLLDSIIYTIHVNEIIPDFSNDFEGGCYPLSVNFVNKSQSSALIKEYKWLVNNQRIGKARDFSHKFEKPGNFSVSLEMKDQYGCTASKDLDELFLVEGPVANFSMPGDTVCGNQEIFFTNQTTSKNPIENWKWVVAEQKESTLENISAIFMGQTNYNISLTATDNKGCSNTVNKVLAVMVPHAYKTHPEKMCTNTEMKTSNHSMGHGLSYTWDFGDGNTSNEKTPVHIYKQAGDYEISLVVTDRYGCTDIAKKTEKVEVISPNVDFEASMTELGCAANADPVQLVPYCSDDINKWEWDFGDNSTSKYESPVKKFAPGSHTITLTGTSTHGCEISHEKKDYIHAEGPVGDISLQGEKGGIPLTVDFNVNANNIKSISWDFGDGSPLSTELSVTHTYTEVGTYRPYVLLEDKNGCAFTYDAPEIIAVEKMEVNDDEFTTEENKAIIIDIKKNDIIDEALFSHIEIHESNNSTVQSLSSGRYRYVPNNHYSGVDVFTYSVVYGTDYSISATVTVTVTNKKDAPILNDTTIYVNKNESALLDIAKHAIDYDGDLKLSTASILNVPTNGNATINNKYEIVYTPDKDFLGTDNLKYYVQDETSLFGICTVTYIVQEPNAPPVAVNDLIAVREDEFIDIRVKDNDYDDTVDNDLLDVSILQHPQHGKAQLDNGVIKYIPNENYHGGDTIVYKLIENERLSDSAMVIINVKSVNDPITAHDVYIELQQGEKGSVTLTYTDPDAVGDEKIKSFYIKMVPQYGKIEEVDIPEGTFVFNPVKELVGEFELEYNLCAADGSCDDAMIYISILPNPAPIARNDYFTINEDEVLEMPLDTFIRRVVDEELNKASLLIEEVPTGEALVDFESDTFTYTPPLNFNGEVKLQYQVCDSFNQCVSAYVIIDVLPVEDPPFLVVEDVIVIDQKGETSVNLIDRFDDPEKNIVPSSIDVIYNPVNCPPTVSQDGIITFDCDDGEYLNETNKNINIKICGDETACSEHDFQIEFNYPPVANYDFIELLEDESAEIKVKENDTDDRNDVDTMEITIVEQVKNGEVEIVGAVIKYTPKSNYFGKDTLVYKLWETESMFDTAMVVFNIQPVNDPIVAKDGHYTFKQGEPDTIYVEFTDPDSNSWDEIQSVEISSFPEKGRLEKIDGSMSALIYYPEKESTEAQEFIFTICDKGNSCDDGNISITIISNDAPVAKNDTFAMYEDEVLELPLETFYRNVIDDDLNPKSIVIEQVSVGEAVVDFDENTFTYTPPHNYFGTVSLRYKICDVFEQCVSLDVVIEVLPVEDSPYLIDLDYVFIINQKGETEINIIDKFGDPENNVAPETFEITDNPLNCSPTISEDGTMLYNCDNAKFFNDNKHDITVQICGDTTACSSHVFPVKLNYPPIANFDFIDLNEDQSGEVDVKLNDTDDFSDVGEMEISVEKQVKNGNIEINGSKITYTPIKDFWGTDTLVYKLWETESLFDTALVVFNVQPANDPIVAKDKHYVFEQGKPDTIIVEFVDPDSDGWEEIKSVEISTDPEKGKLEKVSGHKGIFIYYPDNHSADDDQFTFTICDKGNSCDDGLITISILPNSPPIALNDTFWTVEDTRLVLPLDTFLRKLEDNDLDLGSLTFNSISSGDVNIESDKFIFRPIENSTAPVYINYQICDSISQCASANVTINIIPVNDPPKLVTEEPIEITPGGETIIDIDDIFTDPENNIADGKIEIIDKPSNIDVIINENGELEIKYNGNGTTTEGGEIVIRITDEDGNYTDHTIKVDFEDFDKSIVIDKGFSPDGDGINDFFVIKNIENYPDNELIIFNRWGSEIYQKSAYYNEWDGKTSSGELVPDGTYFYLFHAVKGNSPIKGYIYIKTKKN